MRAILALAACRRRDDPRPARPRDDRTGVCRVVGQWCYGVTGKLLARPEGGTMTVIPEPMLTVLIEQLTPETPPRVWRTFKLHRYDRELRPTMRRIARGYNLAHTRVTVDRYGVVDPSAY